MSEVCLSRRNKINAKWETFQPAKIEGKYRYTQKDIAKVFGIHPITVCKILNDSDKDGYCSTLAEKVRKFAKEIKYMEVLPQSDLKPKHISVHLSTRNYSSEQEHSAHMLKLREDGYTNAQIARATGYDRKTVLRIIGKQPVEYTQASIRRYNERRHRECEDRKALASARKQKIAEANAQVESYNAAVAELNRLNEEVKRQKSVVDQMHDALSSCVEYATVQIISIPAA